MKPGRIPLATIDLTGRLRHHPASWVGGLGHRQRSGVDGDRINVACKEKHCTPQPAEVRIAA